jgi:hypothetical protein
MAEERTISNNQNIPVFQTVQPQVHPNILNMTLGELLNHNATAQNMIMQSMGINQSQFQQFLNSAGNNQMLNMTVSDLFKNGTIAQAMQVKPEQLQQIPNITLPPKQSFFQKLRNLFR